MVDCLAASFPNNEKEQPTHAFDPSDETMDRHEGGKGSNEPVKRPKKRKSNLSPSRAKNRAKEAKHEDHEKYLVAIIQLLVEPSYKGGRVVEQSWWERHCFLATMIDQLRTEVEQSTAKEAGIFDMYPEL